jgi:hypothetical protein
MALYAIQQSTTTWKLYFPLILASDHISPATSKSPTVVISKNGGAFGSPAGAVTELANGWYQVAGNATDTNTLGPLILHATEASSDPTDVVYEVVAYNPQDAVRLGLTALPNAAANAAGGLVISAAGALDIDEMNVDIEAIQVSTAVLPASFPTNFALLSIDANGRVKAQASVQKNVALAGYTFLMTDSTTHLPKTSVAVTVTRSIDGGAFAAGALSAVTEITSGLYKVDFAASDLNGNTIILRATGAASDDTLVVLNTFL